MSNAPTPRILNAVEADILADIQQYIRQIETAIAGKQPGDLVRPKVGDASYQSVTAWWAELAKQRRWADEILKGDNV